MKVTFLQAAVPLTKTFTLENGELKKQGHPRIFDYTSYEEVVESIDELLLLLRRHAAQGHCFLKGNLNKQLKNEPRKGGTDQNDPTQILLLDLDGIKSIPDIPVFMSKMGLSECDHIVQFSSSMGVIPERGLSAHIFVLLDKLYSPALLKQWLIGKNLRIPELRENLGLTRTNNSLRWPLDVTTCQNDKLIYIAPPILGEGVIDSLEGERIKLVLGTTRTASITERIPSAEQNKREVDKALNELRAKEGLHERKPAVYKSKGSIEYMSKPDQAIVTEIKKERGFVYLNINNGDSWAYYHPEHNPEFIYNFKSEPVYKTSELLPEYWAEVKEVRNTPQMDATGKLFLAFRDYRTASYWNGSYDTSTQTLDLKSAKSKDQLWDFLKDNDRPIPEFVPDWNILFDPTSRIRVDIENRVINTFQPTHYMMQEPRKVLQVPRTIRRVIMHALGDDEQVFEHFMNWLAVIIQYRVMTGTAWCLHGTQGTGKGIMLSRILRPLFGYVEAKRMREFDSPFNGFMESCLILWVDEAQLSVFKDKGDLIEQDLKNYITESPISIRKMYTAPYRANSYINLIFASNKADPMIIDPNDRRFNVAVFQSQRLIISDEDLETIDRELEDFYHYLMTRKADKAIAREPLNNAAKQQMIEVGRVGIDRVADALLAGDYDFFVEQIPSSSSPGIHSSKDQQEEAYRSLVESIGRNEKSILVREEVRILLQHCLGDMPDSTYKFATKVKHHGIHFTPVWHDGKTIRGIKIKWKLKNEMPIL